MRLKPRRNRGSVFDPWQGEMGVRQAGWRLLDLLLGLPVPLLLLFASEREARAYTDPGSGALIWQMLVAGFVGAAFYFRRLSAWVRRRLESNSNQSIQQQDSSAARKDEFIP